MGYGKERPCKKCGEVRLILARGLCQGCFREVSKAGKLDQYPPKFVKGQSASAQLEALKTTVRTFLHDLDAHEELVKPSEIRMNNAMWMQVDAFRRMVKE